MVIGIQQERKRKNNNKTNNTQDGSTKAESLKTSIDQVDFLEIGWAWSELYIV